MDQIDAAAGPAPSGERPSMSPRQRRIARWSNRIASGLPSPQRAFGRLHAWLYRRSGGRFLPRWFGAPVLVLETVGRRSGQRRSTPVLYLRDGDAFVVLAANAGSDRVPAWWLNLREAGEGEVIVAKRRQRVRPRLLEGEEREHLWRRFVEMFRQAEAYAMFTDRELPVIALEPIPS